MTVTREQLDVLSDPRRLHVLGSINFDNPHLRAELDRITERTARRTGLPISLATLVFGSAQVMAGSHGVTGWLAEAGGTPAEWAFCTQAVVTGQVYIVPDAVTDPAQAANPLVTVQGFGSYAGIPITIDDEVVGAHCLLDDRPHHFTEEELAELHDAAAEITALLQRYQSA